jgi:threonine synthase
MDISKASNFERYVFDMVERDPAIVRDLWERLARAGEFDLRGTPHWERVRASGFVSGRSTHADRIATIRACAERYGVLIDPHTADGVKVALERREAGVPVVCIETALPAKFAATIREAVGREPERPAAYHDLETRPQRCTVLPADPEAVKAFIARHAAAEAGASAGAGSTAGR